MAVALLSAHPWLALIGYGMNALLADKRAQLQVQQPGAGSGAGVDAAAAPAAGSTPA